MKKILLILSILTTVATPVVATDTSDCKDEENGIKSGTLMNNKCIPSACIENRWQLKRARCIEQKCEFKHGTGKWERNGNTWECKLTACDTAKGWEMNNDNKSCISTRGDSCDTTTIDANATAGEYKKIDGKMTCIITDCAHGYKPNDNGTKCVAGQLSESDSQAKVDELRDNAQAMRDKEQSTANKLLGAAGIGATGIGGMQMASAMAEQSADEDAETAMRAYLATFHCDYGGGQNIPGGKTNVELPGGNELIDLYSEYVNLANDLKVRKTALDMRPGIESESILDAATSGLYDDVAIGKTSGAYTSLARALMDPNGADAAAWAQQKAETADKKKTGMITAGIGAAGSLVGNLAINSGKDKQNKLDEILNKYDKKKQLLDDLQSDVAAIQPQTAPCPDGTTGTAHPDCTCTDPTKIYNSKTLKCEECNGDQTVQDGECKCPNDKPLWDTRTNQCIAVPSVCTPQCTPTEGSHLVVLQDCSCTCIDGYTYKNGKCTCNDEKKQIADDDTCQTISPQQGITTITIDKATLPAASLFQIGSHKLLNDAQTALKKFITGLSTNGYKDCTITVNGYTDPVGNKTNNKTLSQNRADAVKRYINGLGNSAISKVTAVGHGEENCTCGAGKSSAGGQLNGQIDYNALDYRACKGQKDSTNLSGSTRYAPCRRVEISAECKKTTTTSQ